MPKKTNPKLNNDLRIGIQSLREIPPKDLTLYSEANRQRTFEIYQEIKRGWNFFLLKGDLPENLSDEIRRMSKFWLEFYYLLGVSFSSIKKFTKERKLNFSYESAQDCFISILSEQSILDCLSLNRTKKHHQNYLETKLLMRNKTIAENDFTSPLYQSIVKIINKIMAQKNCPKKILEQYQFYQLAIRQVVEEVHASDARKSKKKSARFF